MDKRKVLDIATLIVGLATIIATIIIGVRLLLLEAALVRKLGRFPLNSPCSLSLEAVSGN
jgi:hypothetical protein